MRHKSIENIQKELSVYFGLAWKVITFGIIHKVQQDYVSLCCHSGALLNEKCDSGKRESQKC